MFFSLSLELIQLVESFHDVPYWKERFNQDVLPHLNKGWRLVGGPGDKCHICYTDDSCHRRRTTAEKVWMSKEEYDEVVFYLAIREAFEPTLEEQEAIWAVEDAQYGLDWVDFD